jgi:hypothetical protein
MALHKNLVTTDLHSIYAYSYANAAARTGASGFVTADIGKVAWQTDDDTFWLLKATTPTWAQIGGSTVSDATISITDITTNNVSTSKHGFFPKLPTPTNKFLRDDLTWQTLAGGGDMLGANNLSDVANQQTALNTLTAVTGATNEHVLTKDTGTGNATWKAASGGIANVVEDTTPQLGGFLDCNSKAVNMAKGANISSVGGTPAIGGATDGNLIHITGTTTITAFDTVAAGIQRELVFDGALTLTHNGTSLILPSGANITTAANDTAIFVSEGSGNWRCLSYTKANGQAVVGSAGSAGKKTMYISAAGMLPTISNGSAVLASVQTTAGNPDLNVLDFDATADEHAQFEVAMPKSWDEGTITFQVFWTVSAAVTTGVAWGIQGVAVSNDDTINTVFSGGTPVVVTDTALNASNDMHVTAESSAVTIGGTPAEADMIYFRLFRDVSDAADTMTQDARLIGIKLFYTTNTETDA